MGLNRVMLIGHAARKPELRWVSERLAVAEFPFVMEKTYRTAAGEEKTARTEIPIVAYGTLAEACANLKVDGKEVFVEGRLKLDQWKTTDGQQRSRYCVVADRCEFEGAPPGPPGGGGSGARREANHAAREAASAAA